MTTLHVTNGDSAAGTIQKIVPSDESVLPWRDVLHDGPVPGGVDADTLRRTRAAFLSSDSTTDEFASSELPVDGYKAPKPASDQKSSEGAASSQNSSSFRMVLSDLAGRDAQLAAMGVGDRVVLWFEPDLYDQLQLLQVLASLYLRAPGTRPSISIVASDELLGPLNEAQLAKYLTMQRNVREVDLELAAQGWEAFTSTDDVLLKAFSDTETSLFKANSYKSDESVVLPYVHSALRRLLQEYPSAHNGLSRTEQQIVDVLLQREQSVGELYQSAHAPREDIIWLGDWSFASYIDRMMRGPQALIEFVLANGNSMPESVGAIQSREASHFAAFWRRRVRLTEAGRAVAEGRANAVTLNGIDRWIGGAHLHAAPSPQ